jgi:hypothetical protein
VVVPKLTAGTFPRQPAKNQGRLEAPENADDRADHTGLRAGLDAIPRNILEHTAKTCGVGERAPGPTIPSDGSRLYGRNFGEVGGVCDQELRREVVGALDNERVSSEKLRRRRGDEATLDDADAELRRDLQQALLHALGLEASNVIFRVQGLPVKVALLHDIIIDHGHVLDGTLGEQAKHRGAKPTGANHQNSVPRAHSKYSERLK